MGDEQVPTGGWSGEVEQVWGSRPTAYRTLQRLIRQPLTAPDDLAIEAAGFG